MNDRSYERRYHLLRKRIDRAVLSLVKSITPRTMEESMRFVMSAGGKRVRSMLVILSCEAVGGTAADSLQAAAAIELLHNFTLVHDDIMDNAPSRRGRPTVHHRWDVNTAILAGDTMLGVAYRSLMRSRKEVLLRTTRLFTEALIEVCEGQAQDLELAGKPLVTPREYLAMIRGKTARLMAVSAEIGGHLGGGTPREIRALRHFGSHIGTAFQIQDDLLDVVGDEKHFGKAIGGDIVEGKKTFLLVTALARATARDRARLRVLTDRRGAPRDARRLIEEVADIYRRSGTIHAARSSIRTATRSGLRALRALPPTGAREMLEWFSCMLVERNA